MTISKRWALMAIMPQIFRSYFRIEGFPARWYGDGNRLLGIYLMGLAVIQAGYWSWWLLHGRNDAGWSRMGLWVLVSFVQDLVSEGVADEPGRAATLMYALSIVWIAGVGGRLILGRRPLKLYLATEAALLALSLLCLDPENMTSVGVFLLESVSPFLWATALVFLNRRRGAATREVGGSLQTRRAIPIEKTRWLGIYLLLVCVYQSTHFCVSVLRFAILPSVFGRVTLNLTAGGNDAGVAVITGGSGAARDFLYALSPRAGLIILLLYPRSDAFAQLDFPSTRLFLVTLLPELAFALMLIWKRQPLKTYLAFETIFVLPSMAMITYALYVVSTSGNHYNLFQDDIFRVYPWPLTASCVVFFLVSALPYLWVIRMLLTPHTIPTWPSEARD